MRPPASAHNQVRRAWFGWWLGRRVPRWVDHDAPPIRPWLMLSWDRAQIDSPRDVVFQIAGGHVEMDLLLLQAIRPSRWPMRLHPQKADQATSPPQGDR